MESLIEALSNELEVDLPKSMIDIEVRNNIEQTAQRFAQQGIDVKSTFTPELIKSLAESNRPQAEKNVIKSLALRALSEEENIKIADEDVELKMKEYELEIKNSSNKIDINKLREVIKNDLLTEKILTWLEQHSEINEITESTTKKTKSSSKVSSKSTKTEKKKSSSKINSKSKKTNKKS